MRLGGRRLRPAGFSGTRRGRARRPAPCAGRRCRGTPDRDARRCGRRRAAWHWRKLPPTRRRCQTVASGEMLGTLKVPNGVASASPPPSRRLSSCLGVAWQEAQPPILNMVSPLARLAVRVWNRCGQADGAVEHIERHRDRRCEQAKDNESASQHGASGLAAFSRPAFDRRTRGCATPRGDLAAGFDRALLHFLEAVGQSGREAISVLVTSTAAAHNFWIFGFETCLILDRCRRCLGRRNEGIDGSIELGPCTPDLRGRVGIAGLGIVREQVFQFGGFGPGTSSTRLEPWRDRRALLPSTF